MYIYNSRIGHEAKSEWRKLRFQFNRERKKYCKANDAGEIVHAGKWSYFNSLLFLRDQNVNECGKNDGYQNDVKNFAETKAGSTTSGKICMCSL